MRAVVIEVSSEKRRLVIGDAPAPKPGPDDLLVAVQAISLNHGEVRLALRETPFGDRLDWDFAGEVIATPDGAHVRAGDSAAGFVLGGAWAERVVVAPSMVAKIPSDVNAGAASTLPVAGMTAALALTKREA